MPLEATPYTRRPYIRDTRNMGQLLGLRGRSRADAALRKGDISQQMWTNLGRMGSNAIQGYQERRRADDQARQQAPFDAADLEQTRANTRETDARAGTLEDDRARDKRLRQADKVLSQSMSRNNQGVLTYDRRTLRKRLDELGLEAQWPRLEERINQYETSLFEAQTARGSALEEARERTMGHLLDSVEAAGGDPLLFRALGLQARDNGLIPPEEIDPVLAHVGTDPERVREAIAIFRGEDGPSVGSLEHFLTERYGSNPTAEQIEEGRTAHAASGQVPHQPPAIGSQADYLTATYGERPTPVQMREGMSDYAELQRAPQGQPQITPPQKAAAERWRANAIRQLDRDLQQGFIVPEDLPALRQEIEASFQAQIAPRLLPHHPRYHRHPDRPLPRRADRERVAPRLVTLCRAKTGARIGLSRSMATTRFSNRSRLGPGRGAAARDSDRASTDPHPDRLVDH